jgi:hypothetical protein
VVILGIKKQYFYANLQNVELFLSFCLLFLVGQKSCCSNHIPGQLLRSQIGSYVTLDTRRQRLKSADLNFFHLT